MPTSEMKMSGSRRRAWLRTVSARRWAGSVPRATTLKLLNGYWAMGTYR